MNPQELLGMGALLAALSGAGWALTRSMDRLTKAFHAFAEPMTKLLTILVDREVNRH